MSKQKAFSALDFPLTGRRLIEASAGTGKTYNIANLYLRLLVGDEAPARTVDQILVVTFTRAATDELRGRIREKVEQALRAFGGEDNVGKGNDDALIAHLRQKYAKPEQVAAIRRQLNNALVCMDEACIFTIHGFAVRAIQAFLFETGALAQVELTEGENARRDRVLADLWRQLKLSRHTKLLDYVESAGFSNRESFLGYFSRIGSVEVIPRYTLKSPPEPIEALLDQVTGSVRERIASVMGEREALREEWKKLCKEIGEDALKQLYGDKGNSSCMKKIQECLDSEELLISYAANAAWFVRLQERAEAQSSDKRLRAFSQHFIAHLGNGISEASVKRSCFRALLAQYVIQHMADIELSAMQLDEVITLINNTLEGDARKSARLKQVITEAYPVCMVDEFQDTDPAQFAMFNRLYGDSCDTGFFMIGDPKQSIYQFRGADIFSYLQVKAEVLQQAAGEQRVYPLDTNFRSKHQLVQATNALFAEACEQEGTFFYEGIRYEAVHSCEQAPHRKDKGMLCDHQHQPIDSKPLVFIGNPEGDGKYDKKTLYYRYARDTAQRIAGLLSNTSIKKDQATAPRPLKGGDIAVLVRSGREAQAVRQALLAQQPRILSVYQSQKDSVFDSPIAEDLYHLLRAMDEPNDKSLLKKAMATLFYRGYRLDFALLDQLDAEGAAGDRALEAAITEFESYRNCWEEHGVQAALNALVNRHGLGLALAALPEGDRLLTDYRHLGELLQNQSLHGHSREQLIAWYALQQAGAGDLDEDSKRIRLESDEDLVKIVTIHVSKGLEYPIVFLPFFYLPWQADAIKNPPLYHHRNSQEGKGGYEAVLDYAMDKDEVRNRMQQEMRAEDMRFLYVALTRAIHQCYIGISAATHNKNPIFHLTAWAHLLGLGTDKVLPGWGEIRAALERKFAGHPEWVEYRELFDTPPRHAAGTKTQASTALPLLADLNVPPLNPSHWVIASYSRLAHSRQSVGVRRGGADEWGDINRSDANREETDVIPASDREDIRYRLRGSNRTGDCLHEFFQALALQPALLRESPEARDELLGRLLRKHGLDKPETLQAWPSDENEQKKILNQRCAEIRQWLDAVLAVPLLEQDGSSSLQQIFSRQQALPEMGFDFSLGACNKASIGEQINPALQQMGAGSIAVPFKSALEGLMTGSMDLFFEHRNKIYVLDYKSNTLPGYGQARLELAMHEQHFHLQAAIYAVAAHRYMQQRCGDDYCYDNGGQYSFGGVYYLFLRGMGLADAKGSPDKKRARQGIYFHRHTQEQIQALDDAFAGRTV